MTSWTTPCLTPVAAARPGLDACPGRSGRCQDRRATGRRCRRCACGPMCGCSARLRSPTCRVTWQPARSACYPTRSTSARATSARSRSMSTWPAASRSSPPMCPAAHEVGDVVAIAASDCSSPPLNRRWPAPAETKHAGLGVAQANTWDSRVETIAQIIQDALAGEALMRQVSVSSSQL